MASRVGLVLLVNILFFFFTTLVRSEYVPACPNPPAPVPEDQYGDHYPPTTYHEVTCPINTLKLKVCANVLNLVDVSVGPTQSDCCALIKHLVDLKAAVCLCTALKANILGTDLNAQVSLSAVLNHCGKNVPSGFQCN